MFSSYNVLINDLGIKISLILMKCSGDTILGSILNTEARNVIPEDLGDLDMSRREVIKSKSASSARSPTEGQMTRTSATSWELSRSSGKMPESPS